MVKNQPNNARDIGDAVSIPGSERSLEEEMVTHYSILACTEEPGGLHTVHEVTKSQTQLSTITTFRFKLSFQFFIYSHTSLFSLGTHTR